MTTDNNQQLITEQQKRRGAAARLPLERFAGSVPIIKKYECGEMVEGQGIYLGRYEPIDREGRSLGKIFNVFAAPEDLPMTRTYTDTVRHVAGLKDWHGYDGTNYATDKEFYAAVKNGSYNGGWIIPTRELLVGTEPDGKTGIRTGKMIQPDNLFDHQNKGAFKDTFKTAAGSAFDDHNRYWSSTENQATDFHFWNVRFSDGVEGWSYRALDICRFGCRPVRLVEIAAP